MIPAEKFKDPRNWQPVTADDVAASAKRVARMAWLDDQDATFRALVHEIGLNAACKKDGRRPPT